MCIYFSSPVVPASAHPPPQVCCVPLCGILAPLSALNFLSRPAASLVCGILSASGHSHSQWYQLYFLFALPTLE